MKFHSLIIAALFFLVACNNTQKPDNRGKETAVEKKSAETGKSETPSTIKDLHQSQDIREILCQCWDNKEDADDLAANNYISSPETVYRGFCFFNDGSMYKNQRGYPQQGTWKLKDDQKPYVIAVSYSGGQTESFKLASLKPSELVLASSDNEGSPLVQYAGGAVSYPDNEDDPFYKSNYNWRKKPAASESEQQIRSRVKAMLHFWILYYDHCIQANLQVANFTGLPTPYRWYAGGIYLKKEKDLLANWYECFYNRDQALKAYKMAGDLLDVKYKWPEKEPGWMKKNVAVLRQMEQQLDKVQ